MVSAEALATVNVRAITELYMYIDKKWQRPAFNYLELNQINYLHIKYILFIDSLKCFYFESILFSIVHNDTMGLWNVRSCPIIAYYKVFI